MRILQVCALVSVCVIAAAALALVAMGYTIHLEAPGAHAQNLGGNVAFTGDHLYNSDYIFALMQDGAVYELRHRAGDTEIVASRVDGTDNDNPVPPVPVSELVFWNHWWALGNDGMAYRWDAIPEQWFSIQLPDAPIGASDHGMSGMKGRYGGN